MLKAVVLYGHPESPDAFEKYYSETHIPIALKIPHLDHIELTIFSPGPDGSKPAFYRMAELYFADSVLMGAAFSSPEGQAATNDLQNFATGGVTFLSGTT
ncbi:EthD family reductase [soil metagenome]